MSFGMCSFEISSTPRALPGPHAGSAKGAHRAPAASVERDDALPTGQDDGGKGHHPLLGDCLPDDRKSTGAREAEAATRLHGSARLRDERRVHRRGGLQVTEQAAEPTREPLRFPSSWKDRPKRWAKHGLLAHERGDARANAIRSQPPPIDGVTGLDCVRISEAASSGIGVSHVICASFAPAPGRLARSPPPRGRRRVREPAVLPASSHRQCPRTPALPASASPHRRSASK